MRSYVQKGDAVTVMATKNIEADEGVLIGSLFGIAQNKASEGDHLVLVTRGVFLQEVTATGDIELGDPVYFDASTGEFTDDSDGTFLAGVAVSEASPTSGVAIVDVLIG